MSQFIPVTASGPKYDITTGEGAMPVAAGEMRAPGLQVSLHAGEAHTRMTELLPDHSWFVEQDISGRVRITVHV